MEENVICSLHGAALENHVVSPGGTPMQPTKLPIAPRIAATLSGIALISLLHACQSLPPNADLVLHTQDFPGLLRSAWIHAQSGNGRSIRAPQVGCANFRAEARRQRVDLYARHRSSSETGRQGWTRHNARLRR